MTQICPYCGALAKNFYSEIVHMEVKHPEIIAQRLWKAGITPHEVEPHIAQIMKEYPPS
jgi:hypothetical protein